MKSKPPHSPESPSHESSPRTENPAEIELPVRRGRSDRGMEETVDSVAVERTVEIVASGVTIVRLQASPGDLEDLAAGLVFTLGLVDEPGEIGGVAVHAGGDRVEVTLPGADPREIEEKTRGMSLGSGCGGALFATEVRRRHADAAGSASRGFSASEILSAVREVGMRGEVFKSTGCLHAAGIFREGTCLAFREDIGRHSAIDKVAGALVREGRDARGCLLVTTGRLTAEMAVKGIRLGVWGFASRSAATDRAIELAAEFGTFMASFVRGTRMNIHCGAGLMRPEDEA